MPPETPNGVITHYSVQYGGTVIDKFSSETLNRLMGTVEGLSPNTQYVLHVTAHTRVGAGSPASLSVKTGMLLIIQYSKITSHFTLPYCRVQNIKNKYLDV